MPENLAKAPGGVQLNPTGYYDGGGCSKLVRVWPKSGTRRLRPGVARAAWGPIRLSDFGLPSGFGFRISDFRGAMPLPASTSRTSRYACLRSLRVRLRLRLFPLGARDFLHLVLEDKHALLVADHHVRVFGVADNPGRDFRADTGVVVNQIRDVLSLAFGWPHQFEPVKHRRAIRIRVGAVLAVRPEAFAGD